jgi:hypothetical protein
MTEPTISNEKDRLYKWREIAGMYDTWGLNTNREQIEAVFKGQLPDLWISKMMLARLGDLLCEVNRVQSDVYRIERVVLKDHYAREDRRWAAKEKLIVAYLYDLTQQFGEIPKNVSTKLFQQLCKCNGKLTHRPTGGPKTKVRRDYVAWIEAAEVEAADEPV